MSRRIHTPWDLRYGRRPVDVDLRYFFAPGQLAANWRLYPPWIVTHDSTISSPDTFNANPPWVPTRATMADAHTLREAVDVNTHFITHANPSISVGPLTLSVDIEPDGREWVQVQADVGMHSYFHLSGAGTVGTETGVSGSSIQELTGEGTPGRYRVSVPAVATAGAFARIITATADGVNSFAGDLSKGLKLYNATIVQTSIVTAPNLYGAQMLALYGDRFDLNNPTKASQPVLVTDAWNGLPAAVFSGANWLAADALGAVVDGTSQPWAALVAIYAPSMGANEYILDAGNSATNTPYQSFGTRGATTWATYKRDNAAAAVLNQSITAPDANRHILAWMNNGTADWIWQDAVATTIQGAANVLGACTFNQFTVGALRRTAISNHLTGVLREIALPLSATDAQMLAATSEMRIHNPL